MTLHDITHYYQPTNHSCSQAALAMLLSCYDINITPDEIIKQVPINKDESGAELGTLNQHLATWCLSQGFTVAMHTADYELLDLSWQNYSKGELIQHLKAVRLVREVPALGQKWSRVYMDSYIDFLEKGGQLFIHPYLSSDLLNELLKNGPLLLCVNFNVLYNTGRSTGDGLRKSVPDDMNGSLTNHTIVVYGIDNENNYLIADPWQEPGNHTIEPERLLAAMCAAQRECDNLLFQISKR